MLVLPSDRLVAFSVPGSGPQVVISRGLAEELSDGELTAVLLLLGAPALVGAILGQADMLHHLAGICPSHPS